MLLLLISTLPFESGPRSAESWSLGPDGARARLAAARCLLVHEQRCAQQKPLHAVVSISSEPAIF